MSARTHVTLDEPTPAQESDAGDGSTGMTSGPSLRAVTPPARLATEQLCLTLKPKAPTTGYVDGAWWPRSWDLPTELPALLAVLAIRLGRVQRVSYNLTTWGTAPRRIHIGDHQVRLGGFHAQHPHTVDVIEPNGARLTLLVLSPATNPGDRTPDTDHRVPTGQPRQHRRTAHARHRSRAGSSDPRAV